MTPKVLIVDDIADNIKLLALDLEEAGYEVLTASSARDGLRILRSDGPQIILTDWMMPEMDGIELCRTIRTSDAIGFVYIIMVTAHADEQRLVEAFEAGADDFLSKPVRLPELIAPLHAGVRVVKLESDLAKERRAIYKANAELAVLNEQLDRFATTDELTGLLNRRQAMRRLEDYWETAQRHGQKLSCIVYDIDHFKQFNDTHGHDVGDAVLRQVAATLRKASRTNEQPYRIGGEEFLTLCPASGMEQARLAAERMRGAVADATMSFENNRLNVTISLGVAERTAGMSAPAEILKAADKALYAAKVAGRIHDPVGRSPQWLKCW